MSHVVSNSVETASSSINSSNVLPADFNMGNIISIVCSEPMRLNAVVVVMFLVCFVGIVGNICLLIVIMYNRRLQNAANILIINVTLTDLLYIFSNAPFYMKHELGKPCWLNGLVACQMRHYVPQLAQGVCIFSLAALSRERYVAIVKGMESRITRSLRRTILIASVAWLFGIVIASPVLFLTSISAYGIQCVYLPMRVPTSEAYVMILFLFVYLLPMSFIAVHYCLIARSLYRSAVNALARNSKASMDQMRSRRRLAHVVLVMTVFFGVFWFPHYAYTLWFMYTKNTRFIEENRPAVRYFRYVDYYMALANSCLDPWIVFIMSSVHYNTLKQLRARVGCHFLRSHGSSLRRRPVLENKSTERTTERTLLGAHGVNFISKM